MSLLPKLKQTLSCDDGDGCTSIRGQVQQFYVEDEQNAVSRVSQAEQKTEATEEQGWKRWEINLIESIHWKKYILQIVVVIIMKK